MFFSNGIKPSALRVVLKRDPKRCGQYHPSSFLRINDDGMLEQMWWSGKGDAVWEAIPRGNELTLKDIALGNSGSWRIKDLEDKWPPAPTPAPTLSVPVVDEDGEYITEWYSPFYSGGHLRTKSKELSFDEVCKALQEMCDIQITYQEIAGKESVVIYERDSDGGGQSS